MKKLIALLVCSMFATVIFAQTTKSKDDLIQKVNGEEMKGRVVKVSDEEVTFIYNGETAEYILKKADIAKIIHGSGRIETFRISSSPIRASRNEQPVKSVIPAVQRNKIAVLPFSFLMNNQPGGEATGLRAQEDAYLFLTKNTTGYTLLDPQTTNLLLAKAGATGTQMINFSMKKICDILGVGYLVDGVVIQNKGSQNSTVANYDVAVNLHIYMDNNANIYHQSYKALQNNTDGSYNSQLEDLLKRSPLYAK